MIPDHHEELEHENLELKTAIRRIVAAMGLERLIPPTIAGAHTIAEAIEAPVTYESAVGAWLACRGWKKVDESDYPWREPGDDETEWDLDHAVERERNRG